MQNPLHISRADGASADRFPSGSTIVLLLALAKVLFHLCTAGRYGIFRDELYYLACSEHLGAGYVDQPPLIAFIALAVFAALLLTPQRRFLSNAWIWLGAVCSLLIFLPNLIWLIRHNFPFLELMHNIRGTGRDVVRGPVAFVADQAMLMNPILF